jgi:hypothetical protein
MSVVKCSCSSSCEGVEVFGRFEEVAIDSELGDEGLGRLICPLVEGASLS